MNQYKSGTDEEEPQTLVIEPMQPPISPSKMPISQAEFDDMPLPAASSRLGYKILRTGAKNNLLIQV